MTIFMSPVSSFIGGLIVFSTLGFLANELNASVADVVASGKYALVEVSSCSVNEGRVYLLVK